MTWARIKTGLVVAVLTVLVWVLAESRTLRTEQVTLVVTIADEGDGANLVRVTDPQWKGEVEVTLLGSAAVVADMRERLGGRVALVVGRELPGSPGEHVVPVRDALRKTEALRDSGVTIQEIRPETVAIQVDRSVETSIPVTVRAPTGRLDAPPKSSPASVLVRAPASAMEGIDTSTLEAVAEIDPELLDNVAPGREEVISGVRLKTPTPLAGAWHVSMAPPIVDVTVVVRTRTRSHTIPRLPVQVMLPPPELGRWRISLAPEDTDLFDVVITGPSDAVEKVASGEVSPQAVVSLSFQELAQGIDSKQARIVFLPAGVTARVEDPTVHLKIERVEGDEMGPTP
ncbi:MAG: hypothetical protein R3B57_00220 [Phycisphaerales bacterium]